MSLTAVQQEMPALSGVAALPIPRILSVELAALPPDLARRTDVARQVHPDLIECLLEKIGAKTTARRVHDLRHAWSFYRQEKGYDAIVTLGDLTGGIVALLNRLFGRRPVHVMYDCLWYGGGALKRAWMRFCIKNVDTYVVWASIECERYASTYKLPLHKFLFVPHHHTTKNYQYEVGDDGYLFTGGNWSRDYKLFIEAVREIQFPCIVATNRRELMRDLEIPKHVQIISATPQQFRELLARCRFVVLPMEANLLHAGGQQTFLNAMMMGKPVILTDPEGGRDYIVDGETGVLVPYGNVKALRDAIAQLAQNPKLVREMGERARQTALPLTTQACNANIWQHVFDLFGNRIL